MVGFKGLEAYLALQEAEERVVAVRLAVTQQAGGVMSVSV